MSRFISKVSMLVAASAIVMQSAQPMQPASAATYNANVSKSKYSSSTKSGSYWSRHPKVKAATMGAGVGTAAGAVTGLVTHRGIVRGAAIGAGTGAGVGLIRSSKTMKRHPIANDAATGGAIGLGIGLAAGRGRHPGIKGAAVGSAVGLGIGLLRNGLK